MIRAKHISHAYADEQVLFDINIAFEKAKLNVITGPSGSGKSTLLSILSTLLRPGSGEIFYNDQPLSAISDIDRFRRDGIGFVFQFHYLIEYLSLEENILLASRDNRLDMELITHLGLQSYLKRLPNELSGGQRQRAALVRALANNPNVLFADEPTGNLDSMTSKKVFSVLKEITNRQTTVIAVTHDKELARLAHTAYEVRDGRI